MALPLLAASGAQAADNVTWTAVALCESGGVWSSNTGNGFYGGLQISQETWDEYGGQEYAKRPDLAGISQQMEVADKILAALGPDAWPGCAEKADLEKDDSSASPTPTDSILGDILNPKPADSPSPGSGSGSSSSSGSGSGEAAPTSSSPSPTPSPPSTSAGSRSATHSRQQAERPSTTSPDLSQDQLPGQSHAEPEPEPEPEAESAWGVLGRGGLPQKGRTFADGSARAVTYRVREGDTLCGIAAEKGVSWHELYRENKARIGDDPRLIYPGEQLTIKR